MPLAPLWWSDCWFSGNRFLQKCRWDGWIDGLPRLRPKRTKNEVTAALDGRDGDVVEKDGMAQVHGLQIGGNGKGE